MTNPRSKMARELEDACLISDFVDFCSVASALDRGESRDFILYEMSELERWPKAFAFLQARL